MTTADQDDARKDALAFEREWLTNPDERRRVFQSVTGQEPPAELSALELTMSEWYGATVPDTAQARAERGGLSAIDEIAKRRFERMGAIPAPTSPDASEPDAAPVMKNPLSQITPRTAFSLASSFRALLCRDHLIRKQRQSFSETSRMLPPIESARS